MKTLFDLVGEFHRKFDLPHAGETAPRLLSEQEAKFRFTFLMEETTELFEAHAEGDIAGCADALVDLVYVALGTAHMMGVPFDDVFAEVQRANMTKQRAQSADESKRGSALDVIKPKGWVGPDVVSCLARHQSAVEQKESQKPLFDKEQSNVKKSGTE